MTRIMSPEACAEHQKRYGRARAILDGAPIHTPIRTKENAVALPKKAISGHSKHRNKIVFVGDIKFHSQREANRYQELLLLVKSGEITDLRLQAPFELVPSVELDGRKKPAIRYFADFVYIQGGKQVIEDTKSPHLRKDPVYRIKKHCLKHFHGLNIIEV